MVSWPVTIPAPWSPRTGRQGWGAGMAGLIWNSKTAQGSSMTDVHIRSWFCFPFHTQKRNDRTGGLHTQMHTQKRLPVSVTAVLTGHHSEFPTFSHTPSATPCSAQISGKSLFYHTTGAWSERTRVGFMPGCLQQHLLLAQCAYAISSSTHPKLPDSSFCQRPLKLILSSFFFSPLLQSTLLPHPTSCHMSLETQNTHASCNTEGLSSFNNEAEEGTWYSKVDTWMHFLS